MLSYVPNHSKHSKTTKVIKLRWIGSIWRQNSKKCWVTSQTIPNTAKLQKWSNYDEVHGFDVKTIKMLSYVPNHSKHSKTTKVIKLRWIASISCQKHQTTQNYKSDQITMKCMDLTSKRTKMLSYVANHSKQRKSKKVIIIQWIASIWCQNDKNVELRPKPFETQQNYKSDQITMNCIDLTSKRSKMFYFTSQTIQNNSNLQKYSNYNELHRFDVKNIKQRKTTKVIKLWWSAWIWRQNEQKCWVPSQTIQNNANLKK